MKKLLLKIIIVIACVVGFAFGGAFIGLEAYDLHLTGRHYSGWMGGVGEALLGLCIGAIIGGVAGYKIIKAKTPRASIRIIITLLIFCIGYRVIWVVGIEVRQRGIEVRQRIDESNDIFLAAKNGNIEAVKQHIAAGTDVNARDNGGSTPLHQAAINGHKEIAELLIANGANVNATARVGFTSLHLAAHNGHKEIVELLIAKGADVNAKQRLNWSNGGRTPLHLAAREGHKEVIELLIAKGADVNAKDVEGQTPLDWAKEEKHKEIADLLRKHGGKTAKELKAEGK